MNNHPIVIIECPKCGAMKAARSPYLQPLKDGAGKPDPDRALLMKIECLGCVEITPVPPPTFMVQYPLTSRSQSVFGVLGVVGC